MHVPIACLYFDAETNCIFSTIKIKVLSDVKFFILSSFVYEEKLVSLVSKSNLGAS